MVCGKITFASKGEANEKVKSLQQRGKTKGRASSYFCRDCNAWHLTGGGRKRKKIRSANIENQEVESVNRSIKKSLRNNKQGFLFIKKY